MTGTGTVWQDQESNQDKFGHRLHLEADADLGISDAAPAPWDKQADQDPIRSVRPLPVGGIKFDENNPTAVYVQLGSDRGEKAIWVGSDSYETQGGIIAYTCEAEAQIREDLGYPIGASNRAARSIERYHQTHRSQVNQPVVSRRLGTLRSTRLKSRPTCATFRVPKRSWTLGRG